MAANDYKNLFDEAKKYLTHELNYAKLTATEKLVVLSSTLIFIAIIGIIGGCALFLLSFALVFVIDNWLPTWAAYLIVSILYLIAAIIVYAARKSLIFNPVARFITKLFLNPND